MEEVEHAGEATGGPSRRRSRTGSASPPGLERRHSFRVQLEGHASLWLGNRLRGHYRLHDLCIAGCGLSGGPSCSSGERVEVVLHLPDHPPLWLTACVQRSYGQHLGLRFERPTARMEDRLQDLVVAAYARTHADGRFSLVVEPNPARRRTLVHNLDVLGEPAVGVATPLDAVQLLLERGQRVEMAFIGPPDSAVPSFELIEFLARHYPRVRRVLVGDARALAPSWIAEATGDVHALLETPYSDEALRKLLQRLEAWPHEAENSGDPMRA